MASSVANLTILVNSNLIMSLVIFCSRLNPSFEDDDSGDDRSVTSSMNRGMNNDSGRLKLNKSRRHTIDEFLSKLERDHLDMELSYGNLFQELGYAFLSHSSYDENGDEDDK